MCKDIMKNNFTQNMSLWIVVIFLFFLTGCTIHSTKEISDRLTPGDLYKTFNTKPTDLSVNSKCSTPPTIKIVNIENRTEDFETLQNPPFYGAINPKEMTDSITLYLIGNVNRKLTICDNPILTTPEQSLKFEMTRVNHLTPSLLERA